MAVNNDEMKDVFLSGDKKTMLFMLDYIKNNLGISGADYWNYIGYYVIHVPKDKYESVLFNGRNFACEEDFGIYWINHYNERRAPIAACDVGYGLLPKTLIPGEEKEEYANRDFWGYFDDRTPKTVLEYFDSMKDFLKVDKIIREYHFADDALSISPLDPDYEAKSKLFREFVEKYGYGPFREIHPLTFTGEYVKQPILVKKR